MPSTATEALSRVITDCSGMSSTCSCTFTRRPIRSTKGMMKFSPGLSMRVKAPKRSTVQTSPCGTVRMPRVAVSTARSSRTISTMVEAETRLMMSMAGRM